MNWNDLPDDARVWVYQSNRILNDQEVALIRAESEKFVQSWNSHGTDLQAAIEVFNNLHIAVMVNENHYSASGCSIDKSVKFIQAIGDHLKVDFFDRLICAVTDGNDIQLVKAHDIKSIDSVENYELYDNLVSNKAQLKSEWKKPVPSTWVANFLN